jgi:protein-S-isoprenylcysteine O-methyltransferase Ste14
MTARPRERSLRRDMGTIRAAIGIAWLVFWVGWLVSAFTAKESLPRNRPFPLAGLSALAVVLLLRVFARNGLALHSVAVGIVGAGLFACGLALAIWARVYLGSNWGMPMTQRAAPELVSSGPYRLVRHPIYTGLLLAILGTALATSLVGLVAVVLLGAYFYFAASVEERNLSATFPAAYPEYRRRTKMLIPFVL